MRHGYPYLSFALCLSILPGCEKPQQFAATQPATIARQSDPPATLVAPKEAECLASLEAAKAGLDEIEKTRNRFAKSAPNLEKCQEFSVYSPLLERRDKLNREIELELIKDTKSDPGWRLINLQSYLERYPDDGPSLEKIRKELLKLDAARRKKQGVRIGMSQEEVIASNWGRPKNKNRTINSSGEHEQWVYGNGDYLYFENGRLTSIQN